MTYYPENYAFLELSILTYILTTIIVVFVGSLRFSFGRFHFVNYSSRNIDCFWKVFIIGLPLFVLPAFQYYVGADYGVYIQKFDNISQLHEWLYTGITELLNLCTNSPQSIIIVCSALSVYIFLWTIFKRSSWPLVSLFIYVFYTFWMESFNAIRWIVAVGILVYSLRFVLERKFCKFLLCIILATGFHLSSVCFGITYFLYDGGKKRYYCVLLGAIAIVVFRPYIGKIIEYLMLLTKYGRYYGSVYDTNYQGFFFLVPLAILVGSEILCSKDNEEILLFKSMLCVAVCLSLLSEFVPEISRLVRYFTTSFIFIVPLIIDEIHQREFKIIAVITVVSCFFLYNVRNCEQWSHQCYGKSIVGEYETFWDHY